MPKQVIDQDTGRLGTVPDEQFELAIKSGRFRSPTEEELRYFSEKKEYDDPLTAAWLRYLSSGSFALSDVAIGLTPGGKEDLEKYEKYNPTASLLGEIAGYVSPGGVEGIAAKGVEKLAGKALLGRVVGKALLAPSAPARGMRALSRAVGHIPGKYIPHRYGGKALSTVLGMAGEGVVEGAYFGAHQAVKESVLGDSQLNGEKLFSSIKKEAQFGGMLGGAFGVGGATLRGVGKGLAKGGGAMKRLAYRTWGRGAEIATGAERGLVSDTFNQSLPHGRENMRKVLEIPKTRESAFQDGKRLIAEIDNLTSLVSREAMDARKIKHLSSYLPNRPEQWDSIFENAYATFGKLNSELDSMLARATEHNIFPKGRINSLSKTINGMQAEMWDAVDKLHKGIPSEQWGTKTREFAEIVFGTMDDIKRSLQNEASNFAKGAGRAGAKNPTMLRAAGFTINDIVNKTIRPNLENPNIWGEAGKIQQQLNAVWSEKIPAFDNFKKMFLGELEAYGIGGKEKYVKDAAWSSYVKNHVANQDHVTNKVIQEYLSGVSEHVKNVDDIMHLPPEVKGAVSKILKNVEDLDKKISNLRGAQVLKDSFDSLRGGTKASLSAPIGWGPTALFFSGQPAAGIAMWSGLRLMDSMSNPISSLKNMAGAENFLHAHGNKIANSVSALSRGSFSTVRRVSHTKKSERDKKFETVYVNTMSSTPDEARQKTIEGMPQHIMPDTSLTAGDTAARYQAMQMSMMPVSDVRPHMQGEPPTISKAEKNQIVDNESLMDDPQAYVLDGLKDGTISSTTIAFADKVVPETMAELREMVMDDVQELDSADRLLPFQRRLALEKLFNSQMVAQTNMQYLQEMAAAYSAGQQQQAPNPQSAKRGDSMEISKFYEQGSQRTERGTYKA